MHATLDPVELLQFYADIGVDEAMGEAAVDRTKVLEKNSGAPLAFRQPGESRGLSSLEKIWTPASAGVAVAQTASTPVGAFEALGDARALAAGAKTIEELKAALEEFKGLSLKKTAKQIVFADGAPSARVMVVGEAPGADEDMIGRPFVGVSGQLLDRMFASIGLTRESSLYISNIINWRPPGNRAPSEAEVALSLPFIQRHIELVNPAVLILAGGVAAKALMQTAQGITRLRGKWAEHMTEGLQKPIPVMPVFHPAYLLRTPAQKSLAWADLLSIKRKLRDLGIGDSGP